MEARWLIFAAFGFVLFYGWSPAQAQTTRNTISDLGPLPGAQLSRAQAGHRTNFAAAPPGAKETSAARRLPAFYQGDTPFSTQVRVPVAHLLGGRLRFDGFYREISANNMVRGCVQSNDFWRPIPGGLSLRSAKSYGFTLMFAFSGAGRQS